MKPAQREKLQAAASLVGDKLRAEVAPAAIIAELVEKHGATHRTRWDGNRLSVAGVAATCTWSADKGLLDNWRKTATVRLMDAQQEGAE